MDTCIVCLAELPETDLPHYDQDGHEIRYHLEDFSEVLIARLPCTHTLHNSCLKPWVERANSCPICRQSFNQVDLVACSTGQPLSSYHVEDKAQNVSFQNESLPHTEDQIRQNVGRTDYSLDCFICNETGYPDLLLFCRDCGSPYHAYCLGIERISGQDWRCPPCELEDTRSVTQIHSGSRPVTRYTPRLDPWLRAWRTVWSHQETNTDAEDDQVNSTQGNEFPSNIWNRRLEVAQQQGGYQSLRHIVPHLSESSSSLSSNTLRLPDLTEEERKLWRLSDEAEKLDVDHHASLIRAGPANVPKRSCNDAWDESYILNSSNDPDSSSKKALRRNSPEDRSSLTTSSERKLKRPRTRKHLLRDEEVGALICEASPRTRKETSTSSRNSTVPTPSAPSMLDTLLAEIESPKASLLVGKDTTPVNQLEEREHAIITPPLKIQQSVESSGDRNVEDFDGNDGIIRLTPSEPAFFSRQISQSPLSISLANKKDVEKLVRMALGPHYEAGEMSGRQFADINRYVSRTLYNIVAGVGRMREWERSKWQNLARQEVDKQVELLRHNQASQ